MMTASRGFALLCAVWLPLGLAASSSAVPISYSGYDPFATSLAAAPNSTGAAVAFDAATTTAIVDFETSIPAGVSVSGGGTIRSSTPDAQFAGYNTTPAGANFLEVNGPDGQTLVVDFTTPIESFGAYFTGWQLPGQVLTITYTDDSTLGLAMPDGILNRGGTAFFGFLDAGARIRRVALHPGTDGIGVDDIRHGATPIPEPAALLLLGVGLSGLTALRRGRS